ncbi:DUF2515 domain-containing protein [Bacillus paralicheniformis]|uniref:DUF2515 domain-containing protein n=1 Tax=Bacillus paralicheniformis TaxID=1648923 RepID=UPI00390893E0
MHNTFSAAELTSRIQELTAKLNKDNISRTNAYKRYFDRHPEIKWSLLASFVSRNAGWSMTDLKGRLFELGLTAFQQKWLFLTYERANWLIFSDAYPQLLLYHWSKQLGQPLFHLLSSFGVSSFMKTEWERFWHERDQKRLMYALIINEQNTIQTPIIQNPLFKKNVFQTIPFQLCEWFHFNTVIFPTVEGVFYGVSVKRFTSLKERIKLGKQLSELLFSPELFPGFFHFTSRVPHTGSRFDMERWAGVKIRTSPFLRTCYPVVAHSLDGLKCDWFRGGKREAMFKDEKLPKTIEITDWYFQKRRQLQALFSLEHWLNKR